jgi:hypothetical protein
VNGFYVGDKQNGHKDGGGDGEPGKLAGREQEASAEEVLDESVHQESDQLSVIRKRAPGWNRVEGASTRVDLIDRGDAGAGLDPSTACWLESASASVGMTVGRKQKIEIRKSEFENGLRDVGAHKSERYIVEGIKDKSEEKTRAKRRGLVAFDWKSPPLAEGAKDGAPSEGSYQ